MNKQIAQMFDNIKPVLKMEDMTSYINQGLAYLDQCQKFCQSWVVFIYPGFQNYNRFQLFLFLNVVLLIFAIMWNVVEKFRLSYVVSKVNRILFELPVVKKKISSELETMKKQITNTFPEETRSKLNTIPYNPPDVPTQDPSEIESLEGYLSGSRYPEKRHSDFVTSLSKQFAFSNPLHFDIHPYVKQMQIEVIKMCSRILKFESNHHAIGAFFSGGTQSIIMAILAYREYSFNVRGIKHPNLVICVTGHAAALKACDYFQIEVRKVKVNEEYGMDVTDMKRQMDSNTICVYTSYPNYPYGTVDDIETITQICRKKNVPIHLDMCLGGFIVPFLSNQKGGPMLEIPEGVTSISLDAHKYGLSAKGASILLFSSEKYRKHQLFVTNEWPGGLFGTVGVAGSRSGAFIASAWISMMKLGVKGYTHNAQQLQSATIKLAEALKKLDFFVYGKPNICVVAFGHPHYPVSAIQELMKEKKWSLSLIQKPIALHFSFTPLNCKRVDQMIRDFEDTIQELSKLKAEGNLPKDNPELQLYGACAKIADGVTKDLIINTLLDVYIDI